MRFYDVHDAGVQRHLSDKQIRDEAFRITEGGQRILSDAAAQTIASWWHSPGEPLSTRLSTMGIVDRYLTRGNFATDAELAEVDLMERLALGALMEYVEHHQQAAPSAVRPCSCDGCFGLVVGSVGELCNECSEAGCDNQGSACSREDANALECGCNAVVGCDGGCGTACD